MNVTDLTDFLGVTDTKKSEGLEPEKGKIDRDDLGPRKVLLEWEASPKASPMNIDPRYKKTLMIIGGVVILLLFLMKEFFLILFLASMYFAANVLYKNPIDEIKYEITTHGITMDGHTYYWDELERFFFSDHFGDEYLAVDLRSGFPSRLIMGFKKKDKDKIIKSLNTYLSYAEQEPLTFVDKAYKSVVDKFDLEKKK